MARTPEDIQAQINAEKATHPELDALNSVSSTAIYQLWIYITSVILSLFENVMDVFKSDVQAIIDNNQYGNDQWWYNTVLSFQFGDLLQFINNIYQYEVIDTTKQVVKFCSITSLNGRVQIKAAASVGGQPVVLTEDQLNGLVSYLQQKRPAGIRFTAQSLAADLLKLLGTVYYDAAGDISTIKPAVEAAITNFLVELNVAANANGTANFDGTLYVNNLIDAIQKVPGTKGNQFDLTLIASKSGAGAYQAFTSSYQPVSGYFMVDPDFPLASTLTYVSI